MQTQTRQYLDGNNSQELLLKTTDASITIDPAGAYVTSWKVKNPKTNEFVDILYQGSSKKRTGIPLLFPYFGKSANGRQHGFGRDSTWNVVDSSYPNSISLQLSEKDISAEAKAEYPFAFVATITVELQEDASMVYSLHVKNTGNGNLPISPGLHPYWAVPHESKRLVKAEGLPGFDAAAIDWDKSPPDMPISFNKEAVISFPDYKLTIREETSSEVKYIQVWSQSPDKPDHDFICLEPVCRKTGEFNTNPIVVSPEKKSIMNLRFSVGF